MLIGYMLAVALACILPFNAGEYWVRLMNAALIAAVAVMGLNFVLGYTGQISLMHASVAGIGAYAVAITSTRLGLNPWVGVVIGVSAAGLFSYAMGMLLLRLKGHYFALATLGVNISFTIVAANWVEVTGGSNGITGIPVLSAFGVAADSEQAFFYVGLFMVGILAAFAYYIRQTPVGRSMMAVRDDELAASVSGLNLTRVKVAALTLGGIYAGCAGVLFAFHARFVAPEDFSIGQSIFYLAMLVVGGEATILGSILGALTITFLPEWLRPLGSTYLVVFGLIVVAMLFVAPKGMAGLFGVLREKFGSQSSAEKEEKWRFSKSGQ
ncbi:branched-chain amino acid ABC transporter permease [Cupriavidus numazuensis]|nr:branched-chain amino acid ABC transporter permease [Cupriavidus numazuensis]